MFVVKGETSRSQEIKVKSFHEELCSSDRSGQPDDTHNVIGIQTCLSEENKNVRVEQTHDRSGQPDKHNIAVPDAPEVHQEIKMLNIDNELIRERIEEDMDFKIPGLPHSTVKQLQSANVRELIQKIENHPNRHALQRDVQQSQSFNPFSQESQQMIHEVGNIELCELLDTEPKTQCKVCLSYWDIDIVYCTYGHFLRKGTEENKKFIQYTMDLLSISDYYIEKGRPHGHRYGKKPGTLLQGMIFSNSLALLQLDRLQLTAVYCNRRRCKHNTSNDLAWYKQKVWKKHQNTLYWVDIKLAQKKGF